MRSCFSGGLKEELLKPRLVHTGDPCLVLNLLHLSPTTIFKVSTPESKTTKMRCVVQVLEGKDKGEMSEDISHYFSSLKVSSTKFGFENVKAKDPKMDEEGVPHHGESEGGPHDVAVPQKVKEGEQICPNISKWENRVEEPKQAHFHCHCEDNVKKTLQIHKKKIVLTAFFLIYCDSDKLF